MDQLAEQLIDVLANYGIKRFIGFGVGAGANILCRFALAHPEKVVVQKLTTTSVTV